MQISTRISFTSKETLSYAMAHNRVAVLDSIEIEHAGSGAQGCELVVTLEDAQGPIGHPHRQFIDLAPGTQRIQHPAISLDPAGLLQVDEQQPGWIVVRIESAGEVLAEERHDVQILAAKQWLAWPMPLSLEMLAAHVMPNDPGVSRLLAEASKILTTQTGSPALEGYQSGRERVDAIAAAIYEATCNWGIRYAEPPASWADDGQKIRTPSDVLDGHIGTCLDTTVLIAAALEQAGIYPSIWVVEGHAFVGYAAEKVQLDATATTDGREVVNLVDLGAIVPIETTLVTQSGAASFAQACQSPRDTWLSGDLEKIVGVVDVRCARTNDILPLPARVRVNGEVQVHEYKASQHSTAVRLPARPRRNEQSAPEDSVPPRVQSWKNSLLDLTLRNRLINFTDKAGLPLRVPQGQLASIEDLLHAGTAISLRPQDQVDDIHAERGVRSGFDLPEDRLSELLGSKGSLFISLTEAAYATRMRSLAYKARTILEESGANNLYLTVGTLAWELEGRQLRSPLILIPINLSTTSRGRSYRITLDESGGSTPNYCLLEKLRQDQGLLLPGLENLIEDDYGVDVSGALNSVRTTLVERGLNYRVEESASIGILQFAKFRLWKDLNDHWPELTKNSLVKHLVETPTDEFVDQPVGGDDDELDVLETQCPIPADASQLEAIRDAVAGRTFVLEGPPGTGKSQTITNLLTRAIADGQRVLFVAEKRAALDVVSARLGAVGMRPFCLDLHDKGSKPAAVRSQIKAALEHQVGVDSAGLEADSEELNSARRALARYARRLHETNEAGLSYYTARGTQLARGTHGVELPVPRSLLAESEERHRAIRSCLSRLPETADETSPSEHHPWSFVSVVSPDESRTQAIHEAALRLDKAIQALPRSGGLFTVLDAVRTPDQVASLIGLAEHSAPSIAALDRTRDEAWRSGTSSLTADVAAFVAAAHPGLDQVTPAALDLPLGDLHVQAQAAANSGFFGRKKRLRAVLQQLEPALRQGAAPKPKQVPELVKALVQVQTSVRGMAEQATSLAGIRIPDSWNPLTPDGVELIDRQVEWLRWAGTQVRPSDNPGIFVERLRAWLENQATAIDQPTLATLVDLRVSLSGLLDLVGDKTANEWESFLGGQHMLQRWQETRGGRALDDTNASSLRRWVAFIASLEPLRAAGCEEAWRTLLNGEVEADEAAGAWERGLASASLVERSQATGLDGFDDDKHHRTVQRFARSSVLVRKHMESEVPRQVLDSRPFRASGRGQVGALQRELSRQRGGLGVRALMETYGDLVTQIMPCVLVSPDSVSRFFPVGGTSFDLVVFDEASQIRVAEAVGAMGRAQSVVIVGDSKQMPPTSFGDSLGEGGADDGIAELSVQDQESILSEAVDVSVPRRWLTWHYRSQEESLIAFSNENYYEDKLSSFPAPVSPGLAARQGLGLSLRRVDGTFMRSGKGKLLRTNQVEAEAIVAEISERFAASPHSTPSIGVVTFNTQQRTFIESLLRDSGNARLVEALDGSGGEGLFVKNLENVQGDERDVILFSTAFSVNDKGVLPLNFGPLTRAGGERRLNVAVTRARRQVIVFSSFDPAQLRANETQSVGIKHLRSYLDLAASGVGARDSSGARATEVVDRHREEVADFLRQKGLHVSTNVGLSEFKVDITVADATDPDQPLVAILLDGEGWAKRQTVGDRDGLPVQVLGSLMQWPAVERVWLPSWLQNPDRIADSICQAVEDAKVTLRQRQEDRERGALTAALAAEAPLAKPLTPADSTTHATLHDVAPPVVAEAPLEPEFLPGESTFVEWQPQTFGERQVLDALPDPQAKAIVSKALSIIIETEGPIEYGRLAKLTAASFGLSRVSSDRGQAILDGLAPAHRRGDAGFAWPASQSPDTWLGFRRPADGTSRSVDQVSHRELGNVMVALCVAYAGMASDELLRETVRFLGGKRLTASISARLDDALNAVLKQGRCVTAPSGLIYAA
ncbi:DUF3320 domain-containing protein [Nocardioides salsibiostraticola]